MERCYLHLRWYFFLSFSPLFQSQMRFQGSRPYHGFDETCKIFQMTFFPDIWTWSLVVLNKSQVLTLRKYSGRPSVKGNFFLQPYRARASCPRMCGRASEVNLECVPTAQTGKLRWNFQFILWLHKRETMIPNGNGWPLEHQCLLARVWTQQFYCGSKGARGHKGTGQCLVRFTSWLLPKVGATRRCPKGSLSNFALLVSLLWDGSEDLAGLFKLLHHVHISTTSWSMMVFTTMIMVTVLDCSRLPMGPGAGAPPFNELIEPKLEEAWRKDFVKSWRQASQLQVSSSPLCTAPSRAKLDGCIVQCQNSKSMHDLSKCDVDGFLFVVVVKSLRFCLIQILGFITHKYLSNGLYFHLSWCVVQAIMVWY